MKNNLSKLLGEMIYTLDLFKFPFCFTLDGSREKLSTKLGAILSLGIFGYLFFAFIQSDMILKTNPSIMTQNQPLINRPFIQINSSEFSLSLAISDKQLIKYKVDPSLFIISVFQIVNIMDNKTNISSQIIFEINLTECSDDPLKYCVHQNLELEGYIDEDYSSFIVIDLNGCNNLTYNNECHSQQEIDNFFFDKCFSITYNERYFDYSNYEEPLKSSKTTEFMWLDSKMTKFLNIYIKKAEFIDDSDSIGIFSNGPKKIETYVKDYNQLDYTFRDSSNSNDDGLISEIAIFSSKNLFYNQRTYQKLDQAFANLSGVANFLLIIGFFIANLLKNLTFQKHFMIDLYDYSKRNNEMEGETIEKKNININDKIKQNKTAKEKNPLNIIKENEVIEITQQNTNSNRLNFIKIPPKMLKDSLVLDKFSESKIFSDHEIMEIEENHPLKINIFQYFLLKIKKTFFLKLSMKEEDFLKFELEYLNITNIKFILKSNQDVEKLRNIKFTEVQQKLFELIPRYIAEPTGIRYKESHYLWKKSLEGQNKEKIIFEICSEIMNSKNELTKLDYKLLEYFKKKK